MFSSSRASISFWENSRDVRRSITVFVSKVDLFPARRAYHQLVSASHPLESCQVRLPSEFTSSPLVSTTSSSPELLSPYSSPAFRFGPTQFSSSFKGTSAPTLECPAFLSTTVTSFPLCPADSPEDTPLTLRLEMQISCLTASSADHPNLSLCCSPRDCDYR